MGAVAIATATTRGGRGRGVGGAGGRGGDFDSDADSSRSRAPARSGGRAASENTFDDFPAALEDQDDDLPFVERLAEQAAIAFRNAGAAALSAAVVLGFVNSTKFLSLAITGTLLVFGIAAIAGALFTGRR